MYLSYYIFLYLYNLGTHFYALDGCTTHEDILVTQSYDITSSSAEVQCCSTNGQSCYRHNPDSNECFSGDNDASKATWIEAKEMCSSAGYRLCNSQEELDRCCASGCGYDETLVWTSLVAGIKWQDVC